MAMEQVTLKGNRGAHLIGAVVCVVLVAYNGWNWSQGHLTGSTKMLTVVPALYLALKIVIMTRPMHVRLSGDRFLIRMGLGFELSTPARNVADLRLRDGKIEVRFEDLTQVETSNRTLEMMKLRASNLGSHLELPLGSDPGTFERLRSATLKDRTGPNG